jgi:hypothetical protein
MLLATHSNTIQRIYLPRCQFPLNNRGGKNNDSWQNGRVGDVHERAFFPIGQECVSEGMARICSHRRKQVRFGI